SSRPIRTVRPSLPSWPTATRSGTGRASSGWTSRAARSRCAARPPGASSRRTSTPERSLPWGTIRPRATGWETFTWAAVNAPWRLVWSDEFNGTSIDTGKWLFETGGGGFGNNELENYTARPQNARVENGHLVIEARREAFGGSAYTSARMHTSASWLYGKLEARLRLPFGQGPWPAFWVLGADIGSVGWPACGETDIVEMIGGGGRENTVFGTIHWDNGGHVSFGRSFTGADFSKDYHVFGVEWDTQQIRWYVDNILYN